MKHVIAIDLGGTNIRTGLINEKREVLKVVKTSTIIGDQAALLNQLKDQIIALGVPMKDVAAISVGVPGRVSGTGKIEVLPNIKVFDVPLKSYLEKAFSIPVFFENDAVMAAIAEGNLGAGAQEISTFFITISTGLGGAFVHQHKVKIASEEIGHTLVKIEGQFHELESVASGNGLIKLCSLYGLKVDSPVAFFALVAQKQPRALTILKAWLAILKQLFEFIQKTFQPSIIVLSGGVIKSEKLFLNDLKTMVPSSTLAVAHFEQDAGLIGAAEFGFSSLR